jgi:hypothetical protein
MVDGSTQCYYLDAARNQQGPVSAADIARLVRSGAITRDTMIWFAGMPDWRPAGQVNELASLFGPPGPPARPPGPPAGAPPMRGPGAGMGQGGIGQQGMGQGGMGQTGMAMGQAAMGMGQRAMGARPAAAAAGPTDALIPDFPVWGLCWRAIVFGFCSAFIIPAPWCIAALYRYIVGHVSLPDGRRLSFAGSGGDVWYLIIGPLLVLFILGALAAFIPLISFLNILIGLAVIIVVPYLMLRWVVEKIGAEDGSVKLAFRGSIWGLLGWHLLLPLSELTIIGWAWVIAAQQRWICRNVSGTHRFEFAGTGLEILWRTIVTALACYLIIPIPWMIRWYYSWLVSQIRVADAQA